MSLRFQHNKNQIGKRPKLLKVHAPRNASDEKEFVRFVNDINDQFAQISERLGRVDAIEGDPDSAIVTNEILEERLDQLAQADAAASTSEADNETNNDGSTSQGSDFHEEFPEAAVNDAIPTDAPPKIEPIQGNVGTTTDPVKFALSDHTHEGFTRATAFATPLQAGRTSKKPFQDLAFRRLFLTMGAS